MTKGKLIKLRKVVVGAILLGLCHGIMPSFGADALTSLELRLLGKSFAADTEVDRISRLERILKTVPQKGESLAYRRNRLYALQALAVTEKAQHMAIQAYNQAIDEDHRGNYEAAVRAYNEAIGYNPGMIAAYNNLGNLLERLHKYHDALQMYKKAILQAPNEPLLHRNMGVVYEKLGNLTEALTCYRRHLQLSPNPDPVIQNMVNSIEQQRQLGANLMDYAALARTGTQGQSLLWSKRDPVTVYIRFAPDQVAFLPAIRTGMHDWMQACSGRLRFREVGTPDEAHILITLQEGPLSHPNLEVGHARYDLSQDRAGNQQNLRVYVTVNTGERHAPIALEDRLLQVKRLTLHELGHAIGIWGHSPNPDDIMYSHPMVSGLSERDVRTVRMLYELPVLEKDRRAKKAHIR